MRIRYLLALFPILHLLFSNFLVSCSLNTGLFFGIGLNGIPFSLLSLILLAVVGYIYLVEYRYWLLIIVMAGISNLLDRFILGGVCDYISLPYFPYAFNINDILILIVLSGIIIDIWKLKTLK